MKALNVKVGKLQCSEAEKIEELKRRKNDYVIVQVNKLNIPYNGWKKTSRIKDMVMPKFYYGLEGL